MEWLLSPLRIIGYHMSSLAYVLKDKDVREDALLDRLRIHGTSIVDINIALDRMSNRIPVSVRLPGCLYGRDELIDRINGALFDILNSPENRDIGRDEKARRIAYNISQELHSVLAYDPEVFEHIMNKAITKSKSKETIEPEYRGNVRITH